eukprot:4984037-Amphidinium_carterae.1
MVSGVAAVDSRAAIVTSDAPVSLSERALSVHSGAVKSQPDSSSFDYPAVPELEYLDCTEREPT